MLIQALNRATDKLLSEDQNPEIQATTGPGNLTIALVAHAERLQSCGRPLDFEFLNEWDSIAEIRWQLSYREDALRSSQRKAMISTRDVPRVTAPYTPILPELLSQIPADVEIGPVTADGAYDTRNCHDAVAERAAHAVIPPRKNAKPWKPSTAGAIARNEALRASKYLGRAI